MAKLTDVAKRALKNAISHTEIHNRIAEEDAMWNAFQQMDGKKEAEEGGDKVTAIAEEGDKPKERSLSLVTSDDTEEGLLSESDRDKKDSKSAKTEEKKSRAGSSDTGRRRPREIKCDVPDPSSVWHDDRVKTARMYHRQMDRTQRKQKAHMDDDSVKRSTHYTRKLLKKEENDPDRWAHSGYKELYPGDFDSDRSRSYSSSQSSEPERRAKKKPRRHSKVIEEPKRRNKPRKVKMKEKEHYSSETEDMDRKCDAIVKRKRKSGSHTRIPKKSDNDDEFQNHRAAIKRRSRQTKRESVPHNLTTAPKKKRIASERESLKQLKEPAKVAKPKPTKTDTNKEKDNVAASYESSTLLEKLEKDLEREREGHRQLQQKYVELATQYNELVKTQMRKEKIEKLERMVTDKQDGKEERLDDEPMFPDKGKMSGGLVNRYNNLMKRCQRKQNIIKLLDSGKAGEDGNKSDEIKELQSSGKNDTVLDKLDEMVDNTKFTDSIPVPPGDPKQMKQDNEKDAKISAGKDVKGELTKSTTNDAKVRNTATKRRVAEVKHYMRRRASTESYSSDSRSPSPKRERKRRVYHSATSDSSRTRSYSRSDRSSSRSRSSYSRSSSSGSHRRQKRIQHHGKDHKKSRKSRRKHRH